MGRSQMVSQNNHQENIQVGSRTSDKIRKKVVKLNNRPTPAQYDWLVRGLEQPGGKLPLFDLNGKRIDPRTIRSCIDQGWADPWFANPVKPDWLVCRLSPTGREIFSRT